ncbi:hypothetical protein [Micromonospora parathelypteridis]|uniref:Uncharacterized protein n=1 Tax=Micromonospora parathelypteridis TaxID=1839617 RepID=A0A840VZS8_9ACTN|nr:hypothetical protein [Micromonospora parathelypteridis]MBB5479364.1 hypothetical protein [Micromonospora parathelypteridis]GGO01694.1 hypothetical protein GCM10011576_00340 [Micromonospora parathelypteridis]
MANFDLGSTVQELTFAVEPLSLRLKSALFGACAEALMPLLNEVERRTSAKWTFPDARVALDLIPGFVEGGSAQGDHLQLRQRLLDSGPNGHELDSPWSSYAQDALTCVDAALVAASTLGGRDFKPIWIQYVINPMVVSLDVQGYDVEFSPVPRGGSELQVQLDRVIEFLHSTAARISVEPMNREAYGELIEEAAVIRPTVLG